MTENIKLFAKDGDTQVIEYVGFDSLVRWRGKLFLVRRDSDDEVSCDEPLPFDEVEVLDVD